MVYTEVLSGFWIGNIDMMYNKQFINDNDINVIINCTINFQFKDETKQNIRIPLVEDLYGNIETLKNNKHKILSYINTQLENHNILLCCYDGQTLSPFIAALYLLEYGNIPLDTIKQILRSKNTQLSLDFDSQSLVL